MPRKPRRKSQDCLVKKSKPLGIVRVKGEYQLLPEDHRCITRKCLGSTVRGDVLVELAKKRSYCKRFSTTKSSKGGWQDSYVAADTNAEIRKVHADQDVVEERVTGDEKEGEEEEEEEEEAGGVEEEAEDELRAATEKLNISWTRKKSRGKPIAFGKSGKKEATLTSQDSGVPLIGEEESSCEEQKDLEEESHAVLEGGAVELKTKKKDEPTEKRQREVLYKRLRDGNYTCDICQTTFEQKSKILRHITSKHSFHRPFKCATCSKAFKYKYDLKAHKLVHEEVDSSLLHCCDKCEYRTKTKNNLKSHYIRKHTDDYKFSCEHCGKRFKMEWDLKFHIGTHSNSQHMCDICGRFYTSNYSLYKHRKVAHLNEYKFQCSICNKRLLTQENLESHMLQHNQSYVCKDCGKVFASKRYLATHKTTHTGVKPYPCHICEKNFRTSHMRKTHLLTHSAERPHICDLCGQAFKRRYYMIEHRRKHPDAHLSSPPVPLGRNKILGESSIAN